jgi:hypothetical protein
MLPDVEGLPMVHALLAVFGLLIVFGPSLLAARVDLDSGGPDSDVSE